MKRVLYGLLAGVLLCGAASMALLPVIKKQSFYSGYDAGHKNGITNGTATGKEEGMEKMRILQQAQHEQDSLATEKRHRATTQKMQHHARKAEKPVQNWHVIDNRIAEPMPD